MDLKPLTPGNSRKRVGRLGRTAQRNARRSAPGDIGGIPDEAITNIDDASTHDEKNPLVAKAVRRLAAEATQLKNQLLPLKEQAKSEEELASLEHLLENGQTIIDATTKLPPPAAEQKGKRKAEGKN